MNAPTEDEGDSEVVNYCTDEEYDGIEIDNAVDFPKVEGEDYRQPGTNHRMYTNMVVTLAPAYYYLRS